MAIVQIGDKKVQIGEGDYKPTQADVEIVAQQLGIITAQDSTQEQPAQQQPSFLSRVGQAATQAISSPSLDIAFGPGMAVGNEFKRQMMNINPEQKFLQGDISGFVGDYAKDYFTDPRTYAMGLMGAEASSKAFAEYKSRMGSPSQRVFRKTAIDIKRDMGKVNRNIRQDYANVVDPIKDKIIPNKIKTNVVSSIADIPSAITEQGRKVIDSALGELQSPNLTAGRLHTLRQELWKQSKNLIGEDRTAIRKLYDAASDAMADKSLAGPRYKELTAKVRSYKTLSEPYTKKLVTEKSGGREVLTESKLKRTKELDINQQKALKMLAEYSGSKNRIQDVGKMIGRERLKKLAELYGPRVLGYGLGIPAFGYAAGTAIGRGLVKE